VDVLHPELESTHEKMQKTVAVLRRDLSTLRAGRATPALLERVMVDYYGTSMPLPQLAQISVPEPRLLVIQPWDKGALPAIEKGIQKSDLGLTPVSDGQVIRLALPQLTEERRRELVKVVRKKAEEEKVALRNLRREALEHLKSRERSGALSEDESRRLQEELQRLTDSHVREIDQLADAKEQEIMEV
jgi:ribosome recycling factor